jgi:hypothetical protein
MSKKKSTKRAPKRASKNKDSKKLDKALAALFGGTRQKEKVENPFRDGFRKFLKPSTARNRSGQWREPFLKALAGTSNVTIACRYAGVDRTTVYEHKKSDAAFAAAWQEALDQAIELMEAEMERRAFAGTERPVFQGGLLAGTITEYSDTLAIFLAKAHRPEKYRERIAVKNDNPERKPLNPTAVADKITALLGELQPLADPAGPEAGGPDQHSAG